MNYKHPLTFKVTCAKKTYEFFHSFSAGKKRPEYETILQTVRQAWNTPKSQQQWHCLK